MRRIHSATPTRWRGYSNAGPAVQPERAHIAQVNRDVSRAGLPHGISPTGEAVPHVGGGVTVLPDAYIVFGQNRAVRYHHRTGSSKNGEERCVVTMTLDGCCRVERGDHDHVLAGGDTWLGLLDDTSSVLTVGAQMRDSVSLIVSRRRLAAMMADLDSLLYRPVRGDWQAQQLLLANLRGLRTALVEPTGAVADCATNHLYELLGLAFGASPDLAAACEQVVPEARFQAIKDDVVQRVRMGLPVRLEAVAARQCISSNYVQKLFASQPLSFSQFVLKQRLEQARRLLCNACSDVHTVSWIAYEAGFANLSWFNRAFRREYGVTPSEMRESGGDASGV